MTNDTLYILVTCSLEQTRFDVLKKVISNLNEQSESFNFKKDLLVFDNGSTIQGNDELLTTNFQNVYKSKTNVGFWSALHWSLQNYQQVMQRNYKFVYVIESDLIHYDMFKLQKLEHMLESIYHDVGSVRCEEFEFKNKHLYNKDTPQQNSRTYAWCRFYNAITNSNISFLKTEDPEFFLTNFVPKICSFNRIDAMCEVIKELASLSDGFSEFDFQKFFHKRFSVVGLLDGGIFHSKLTNADKSVLSASYSNLETQKEIGYIDTRVKNVIIDPTLITVTRLQ